MAARRTVGLVVAASIVAAGCSGASDAADTSSPTSNSDPVVTDAAPPDVDNVDACVDDATIGDDAAPVAAAVEQSFGDLGLTSVVYRVTRGDDLVAAGSIGESMSGVAVDPTMQFRVGNVAFGYMGTLLLLLVEDGVANLDDPISAWLPDLDVPNADSVTLEMLVRNTSGYPDYVGNDDFADAFYDDPFRNFTPQELLDFGLQMPVYYEPGMSWNYSHTNFVILGQALESIGGTDLATMLSERVFEPIGLADTASALTPEVPEPVLHTYSTERDVLEDTTFWNPTWQTAPGGVVTSNICDLVVSAAAIGSGALLSDASYEAFIDDQVIDLGPPPDTCPDGACREMTSAMYYGLGTLVFDGWVAQAPIFAGAGGVNAYLPEQDVAIAIQAVTGVESEVGVNPAMAIWSEIAQQITPDNLPLG